MPDFNGLGSLPFSALPPWWLLLGPFLVLPVLRMLAPGISDRVWFLWSHDHKTIAKQFLFSSVLWGLIGGALAMIIRWQLANPGEPIPYLHETLWPGTTEVTPEAYNAVFTLHGTIMIFFVIIPLLVGAFGNFVVPLMIGAKDMAFPLLNALSFWLLWPAFFLVTGSFFLSGEGPGSGWTAYPPVSHVMAGHGQTLWLLGILLAGIASTLGAVNYIVTVVTMRAEGMTFFRLPLTVWGLFITAILSLLATPVLASGLMLQIMDRVAGTAFFLPAGRAVSDVIQTTGGGQVVLWQHLFWFYSHPAVYVMVLPALGMVSDMLSAGVRKPIFGYRPMVYAMKVIAILGFLVWGHHMFVSGMAPGLGRGFMLATMLIALPSAVKTFNWLGTLSGSRPKRHPFVIAVLAFISMWIIGGLSGIFLAATPVDVQVHDTYLVVAHFHYIVFGASLFAVFAGLHYWFPKMFGRHLFRWPAYIHLVGSFVAFNIVFFPMHVFGTRGMLRRTADPYAYGSLQGLLPANQIVSIAAYVLMALQVILLLNVLVSLVFGRRERGTNPWGANTLEWATPCPPVFHGNFDAPPVVHHGPYEYGQGLGEQDHCPQTQRPAESPTP